MQSRWTPRELVEPGGQQDWWRQGGDHRDWLVARWRPRRQQSQAEFTEAGRTRWRPQKENHEEVDRLSTGLVVGTLVAEQGRDFNGESARSLGSGMGRNSKALSQKETE